MYGNEIKSARLTTGETQSQVARATGLPQNTISWIELDKGIPNIQQCVLLADHYGISINELIGHEIPQSSGGKPTGTINNNTVNINFKN